MSEQPYAGAIWFDMRQAAATLIRVSGVCALIPPNALRVFIKRSTDFDAFQAPGPCPPLHPSDQKPVLTKHFRDDGIQDGRSSALQTASLVFFAGLRTGFSRPGVRTPEPAIDSRGVHGSRALPAVVPSPASLTSTPITRCFPIRATTSATSFSASFFPNPSVPLSWAATRFLGATGIFVDAPGPVGAMDDRARCAALDARAGRAALGFGRETVVG